VLGALGIGKALTTPVAPATAERPLEETTIGADFGQETLTKADRLEIAYVPPEPPAPPALQPVEPLRSPISSTVQQAEPKIISRHWHQESQFLVSGERYAAFAFTLAAGERNEACS
jgi:hypothetical protein